MVKQDRWAVDGRKAYELKLPGIDHSTGGPPRKPSCYNETKPKWQENTMSSRALSRANKTIGMCVICTCLT